MFGLTYYISFRPMCLIVITTGTEDNFTINFLIVKKVGFSETLLSSSYTGGKPRNYHEIVLT